MINRLKKIDYRYYIGIVIIAIAIVFGTLCLIRSPRTAEAEWFNNGWYYRKSIPLTNNTTSETEVYISVTIDTSDTTKFQADCDDLRFTNGVGNELSYYLVSGCGTASTVVHVYFDNLISGFQSIYYYGNSTILQGSVDTDFFTLTPDYFIGSIGGEEQSTASIGHWLFDEREGGNIHNEGDNVSHGTLNLGSGGNISTSTA